MKNVNFSPFLTSCFYSIERRFFFLRYCKTHFMADVWENENMEKWRSFDQNDGLWKNLSFSTFWTSCFYSLGRPIFAVEYRKTRMEPKAITMLDGNRLIPYTRESYWLLCNHQVYKSELPDNIIRFVSSRKCCYDLRNSIKFEVPCFNLEVCSGTLFQII